MGAEVSCCERRDKENEPAGACFKRWDEDVPVQAQVKPEETEKDQMSGFSKLFEVVNRDDRGEAKSEESDATGFEPEGSLGKSPSGSDLSSTALPFEEDRYKAAPPVRVQPPLQERSVSLGPMSPPSSARGRRFHMAASSSTPRSHEPVGALG